MLRRHLRRPRHGSTSLTPRNVQLACSTQATSRPSSKANFATSILTLPTPSTATPHGSPMFRIASDAYGLAHRRVRGIIQATTIFARAGSKPLCAGVG